MANRHTNLIILFLFFIFTDISTCSSDMLINSFRNFGTGGSSTLTAYIQGSEATGDSLQTGSGVITLNGATHAVDHNSTADGAILTDDDNEWFQIQTNGNIDYTTAGKISFWVYPTQTQVGNQYRYLFSNADDYHVFCLVHEANDTLRFRSSNGSVYFPAATSTDLLTQNAWHFIEITWDFTADEATLTIDSGTTNTQTMTYSPPSQGDNLRFLSSSGGASATYFARIDTISIYSTASGE